MNSKCPLDIQTHIALHTAVYNYSLFMHDEQLRQSAYREVQLCLKDKGVELTDFQPIIYEIFERTTYNFTETRVVFAFFSPPMAHSGILFGVVRIHRIQEAHGNFRRISQQGEMGLERPQED
jgi:hypothetical protein